MPIPQEYPKFFCYSPNKVKLKPSPVTLDTHTAYRWYFKSNLGVLSLNSFEFISTNASFQFLNGKKMARSFHNLDLLDDFFTSAPEINNHQVPLTFYKLASNKYIPPTTRKAMRTDKAYTKKVVIFYSKIDLIYYKKWSGSMHIFSSESPEEEV